MAGVNKNFVVKNGLEVKSNLILADADINGVGIGTSNIYYKLHVNGGIGATDLHVTGIATFSYIHLNGTVAAGSSTGVSGQYLVRSGAGVTWQDLPTFRTTSTQTATSGQTSFSFTYTVGYLDVYVNGVRLSSGEFAATDGSTVVLYQSCFGGETVELIAYTTVNPGYAETGIQGISILEEGVVVGNTAGVISLNFVGAAVTATGTGVAATVYITDTGGGESYWESTAAGINTISNVGIATTNPRFALEVGAVGASGTTLFVNGDARITGILTIGTSSITLNGSTNIINVGTGVTINGSTGIISATSIVVGGTTLTGAAVTRIEAGSGISVDQNTGQVTITATGGGGGGIAGINTSGTSTFTNLNVTGVTTSTGGFVGNVTGNATGLSGTPNITVGTIGATSLNVSGVSTFAGITTVTGTTLFTNQLSVSGISTFVDLITAGRITAGLTSSIIPFYYDTYASLPSYSTYHGAVAHAHNTGKLYYAHTRWVELVNTESDGTVGTGTEKYNIGITSVTTLNVSGVSTLSSNVSVGGTISIDGGVTLATNNATIVGTAGSAGEIKQIAGAPFYYDGSAWREFVLSSGTPVTVPADTEWDNVVFRATFDTDFTDAKFGATPVFVSAGCTIVGAAVTIGTGAYRNQGGNAAGVGVSYAYRSEYDFTGSWTIEFWIYHDSTPVVFESLVSQVSTTDTSGDWTFGIYNNGINVLYIWANENHPVDLEILQSINLGTWQTLFVEKWNHYALVREGDNGSLHFYINGYEVGITTNNSIVDNDILHINGAGLGFGAAFGNSVPIINGYTWNSSGVSLDAIFDDVRISAGVGTAGQRYTSIGISTYATFTPPTTELPTTGTLSSYVQPPGDKYGEITLGGSPTWRGTSGVTVSQQSSGNYRVSFASSHTNANDYFVLSQGMDQGFASYVGIARSTTHVDLAINKQSDDTAVDTGALAVQIKNHI